MIGTFDQAGEPVAWGLFPNMNAATGEKFWPPLEPEVMDGSTKLYCGWSKWELRELWQHICKN